MARKIILSKVQQTRLDEAKNVKLVNQIIPLHKVGINWFGKCVFCNDEGHHFCLPDKADKVVCFNGKCKVNWSIEYFLKKFEL